MLWCLRAVGSAALILLAGCSVPRVEATQGSLGKIGTLAVIIPPEPKTIGVADFGHPGMAFGLIGGIAASADMKAKQDRVTAALKSEKLELSPLLVDRVVAGLAAGGYQARAETGPWREIDGKLQLRYEEIQSDADAVLVLVPNPAFMLPNLASDFLPTMLVTAVLLDKDRKTQLYRGFHASGWKPTGDGWRHTPAKVTFPTFDAVMQSPPVTAIALKDGTDAVAATVVADLRR